MNKKLKAVSDVEYLCRNFSSHVLKYIDLVV